MAYTYVSAVTRATRQTPDWVATDLSSTTLDAILNQYADVAITLTNPIDSGNVYLSQAGVRQMAPIGFPLPTLTAWLASLGDASLPTTTTPPSSAVQTVGYSDLWQAGFTAALADINRSTGTQLTPSAKNDLLFTKAGLDMASMSAWMLATVNGYLHLSGGSVDGLYVIDGGKSNRISGNNYAGIFSFYQVGQVTQIPLTAAMIHKPASQLQYAQSVYVDLGVDLTGKILLMSIGGYLHALDATYTKVGTSTVKINMHAINFPERIYQSMKAIDLSSLPLERGPSGATSQQFTVASLASDATILAYLTLSQSFAIVVDASNFYRKTHDLEVSPVPGRYFGASASRFPLIGPQGRLWDYRLSQEEDTYVYGCEPMHQEHYLFQTTDWRTQLSIGPVRLGSKPWSNGKASLLELGSFT